MSTAKTRRRFGRSSPGIRRGPGADEAMTMLEHMIRGEDASTDVGDDGIEVNIAAAGAAIAGGAASAPLIRLPATLALVST